MNMKTVISGHTTVTHAMMMTFDEHRTTLTMKQDTRLHTETQLTSTILIQKLPTLLTPDKIIKNNQISS